MGTLAALIVLSLVIYFLHEYISLDARCINLTFLKLVYGVEITTLQARDLDACSINIPARNPILISKVVHQLNFRIIWEH